MLGLMQDWPLLVHKIIDHAALYHGDREVVTRTVEGPIHRTNYREIAGRARRVAHALEKTGIKPGDRVARWPGTPIAIWKAGTASPAIGAIYHTLNPRLFPDQLVYIANHAEDNVAVLRHDLHADLVAQIAPQLKNGQVLRRDDGSRASAQGQDLAIWSPTRISSPTPTTTFEWKEFDENTACGLCYTSGTTGNPKGVLYCHRSNVHACLHGGQTDAMGSAMSISILPIVPMFHANAWALAFAGADGRRQARHAGAKARRRHRSTNFSKPKR